LHLQGFARITADEIEEILNRLYPPEPSGAALDPVVKEEAA
jgi:hypothetical protein